MTAAEMTAAGIKARSRLRPLPAGSRLLPLAAALGIAGIAGAQDEAVPDLDFLEYLGSWQDGDDEWVVVAGIEEGLLGTPAAASAPAAAAAPTAAAEAAAEAAADAAAADAAATGPSRQADEADDSDDSDEN